MSVCECVCEVSSCLLLPCVPTHTCVSHSSTSHSKCTSCCCHHSTQPDLSTQQAPETHRHTPEGVDKHKSRGCHQRLRQRCECCPQQRPAGRRALCRHDSRDCKPLRNVMQPNRQRDQRTLQHTQHSAGTVSAAVLARETRECSCADSNNTTNGMCVGSTTIGRTQAERACTRPHLGPAPVTSKADSHAAAFADCMHCHDCEEQDNLARICTRQLLKAVNLIPENRYRSTQRQTGQ
jgi:hypothetical protein